jgi:hypothetical protein
MRVGGQKQGAGAGAGGSAPSAPPMPMPEVFFSAEDLAKGPALPSYPQVGAASAPPSKPAGALASPHPLSTVLCTKLLPKFVVFLRACAHKASLCHAASRLVGLKCLLSVGQMGGLLCCRCRGPMHAHACSVAEVPGRCVSL